MNKTPISACIITYNEADRIDRCLESLAFCDEIVVVDSHSTDQTCERALAHGARVIERTFTGYRSQKDFTVNQAKHDWVLCVDADEQIDDTLRAAILAKSAEGFDASGYRLKLLAEHFGRFLHHGDSVNHLLRLFDRRCGGWHSQREIHESVVVEGKVAHLPGYLLHRPYRSLSEHVATKEKYAHMLAEHRFAHGKPVTIWKILFQPWWSFVRGYVLRGGFLDGWQGLLYALLRIEYVRRKYVKLWLMQHGEKP